MKGWTGEQICPVCGCDLIRWDYDDEMNVCELCGERWGVDEETDSSLDQPQATILGG